MTRFLARLADLAYRRRGRMVVAWIVAMVVIIGVGSSLAGEYEADYHTPGSESKSASELTQERFEGYSGQEINVVWKDEAGADSPAARERVNAFFAEAEQVDHVAEHVTPIRYSEDGTIGSTILPLTVNGWDVAEGGRREAGRRSRGEQRRWAGDRARRGSDLPGAGVGQPGGGRAPRGHDRAADRLRLGGRRRAAPRDRPRRPWHLVRGPDRAARQRRRRPRLDHGGVRADRDRGRHRLLVARPDPVPGGDEGGQGPPRRRRRGRHHRRAQRDHRRLHRRDRRPRPRPDRPALHVRGRPLGLLRRPGRDGRRGHAAAGAPLLPRPARSTACGSPSSAGS